MDQDDVPKAVALCSCWCLARTCLKILDTLRSALCNTLPREAAFACTLILSCSRVSSTTNFWVAAMADSTENVHESKVATPREMIMTFFKEVDTKRLRQ